MKKSKHVRSIILCIMLSIALTLSPIISIYAECSPVAALQSSSKNIEITLLSASLDSNNHVGNDWYYSAAVNGKEICEGDTVTLNVKSSSTIKLAATATEDDSIPDVGRNQLSIAVSKLKPGTAATYSLKVRVVENRGRYSGNSAVWVFKFSVKAK